MRLLNQMILVLVVGWAVPGAADSEERDVASTLVSLSVSEVMGNGVVLTKDREGSDSILVGIPVRVRLPNACTTFVGQTSKRLPLVSLLRRGSVRIGVVGAQNPLTPVCIQIAPEPVETHLTVEFKADSRDDSSRLIVMIGKALYRLTLDRRSDDVTITRLLR